MPERILLGMLTPSSNTVLEPVTSAMLAGLPDASAHFGRFRVTEISLRDEALNQFNNAPLLRAAELLADARVNVIAWNGTSAGWLGFDADEALCRAITTATGIAACTSVLALNEALRLYGARRIGLVTPYLHNVQDKIIQNYSQSGFEIVAEKHLNDPGNFSFSEVSATALRQMIYEVAASKPDAITTFCTNLRAAPLVEELEQEIGIPILDTISVVVWQSLRLAGADPTRVQGWGRLFRELNA
ncbi:MAG: aspartate/glutamate racemase family protein [Candidatus Competibacteraceae bacterium]|nr:aspartate/glutamate racemase family protein [Candidatus Competibacteraceae bacterium]